MYSNVSTCERSEAVDRNEKDFLEYFSRQQPPQFHADILLVTRVYIQAIEAPERLHRPSSGLGARAAPEEPFWDLLSL